jgi:hypothetical protein
VKSVEAGETQVVAASAVDCWALGLMAFELLTSKDAFDAQAGPHMVRPFSLVSNAWKICFFLLHKLAYCTPRVLYQVVLTSTNYP